MKTPRIQPKPRSIRGWAIVSARGAIFPAFFVRKTDAMGNFTEFSDQVVRATLVVEETDE